MVPLSCILIAKGLVFSSCDVIMCPHVMLSCVHQRAGVSRQRGSACTKELCWSCPKILMLLLFGSFLALVSIDDYVFMHSTDIY